MRQNLHTISTVVILNCGKYWLHANEVITCYFKGRTKDSCRSRGWGIFHWPTIHVFPPQNIWKKKKKTQCASNSRAITYLKLKVKKLLSLKLVWYVSLTCKQPSILISVKQFLLGHETTIIREKRTLWVNFLLFLLPSLSFITAYLSVWLSAWKWRLFHRYKTVLYIWLYGNPDNSIEGMVMGLDPVFYLHCSASPSWHLYLNSEGRAFYDFTWSSRWRAFVIVVENEINLVGLCDVQLVAFRDLLEVCALVECAAQTGLPHGGVGFVFPLPVLALVHGPSLNVETEMSMLIVKEYKFTTVWWKY